MERHFNRKGTCHKLEMNQMHKLKGDLKLVMVKYFLDHIASCIVRMNQ